MVETIYENHLNREYVIENGEQSLIVTSRSCYRVAHEAAWLISHLPREGTRENYVNVLSSFGLLDPLKILERLISIGILRVKSSKGKIVRLIRALFMPNICLIPARFQETVLRRIKMLPSDKWLQALIPLLVILCLALASETALHTGTALHALEESSFGVNNITVVLALLVLGSVIHEMGHSLAAAASGIGLRPIGFAIYLFFPVLYSNVSGTEDLPLNKKIAIDCGGLIAQSGYLIALVVVWLITRNICVMEAISWTGLMMFFNLNPLLRTDGYWLYQDIRTNLHPSRFLTALHLVYLALFLAYTLRLFYWAYTTAAPTLNSLSTVIHNPALLLTEGYKILLGSYALVLVFIGGLRRLQESRQELMDIKTKTKRSPLQ